MVVACTYWSIEYVAVGKCCPDVSKQGHLPRDVGGLWGAITVTPARGLTGLMD